LVTHDLEEAFLLSHRVAVMQAGEIHQVDTPEALRTSPATDYVRSLIQRVERRGKKPGGEGAR
jgi:ABC-type proline/glycine betaine transport system ATPase subunit